MPDASAADRSTPVAPVATPQDNPLLVDLFCGVGGCSVGYRLAGFDVVGVDLVRQWEYPYRFIQGDALRVLADLIADGLTFEGRPIAAIAASPPCKVRTVATSGGASVRMPRLFEPHADLVTPTLAALHQLDIPWIVENVPNPEPLDAPHVVTLCGSMFEPMMKVRRHRLFASPFPLAAPRECRHAAQGQVVGVYGHGGGDRERASRKGGGGIKVARQEAADALGIWWTTDQSRLSQAIPPAYTEHLGRQLLAHLDAAVAA